MAKQNRPLRLRYGGSKGAAHEATIDLVLWLFSDKTPSQALCALHENSAPISNRNNKSFSINAKERGKAHQNFAYLKRHNYIHIETRRGQTYVVITRKGSARAKYHIWKEMLLQTINRPAQWDRKWRLILFDVPTEARLKRDAFRSLIRRLGAVQLQKSVWIFPFDCNREIDELRDFFDLSEEEVRVVQADSIGSDAKFRKHFKL